MEPHPPSSTATVTATAKLRLMCSHGGHIVPRPSSNSTSSVPNTTNNNKAFFYVGGDTRIISVDRHAVTTIASFVSHLAAALSVASSFTLKYQLPHVDLDSLISLTSNEDFKILIDEYDRLCSIPPPSSPAPSRIRVFLFRMDPGFIRHPKTEAWFFDALKNAKIVGGSNNGFLCSAQESMVLEMSSSFGSASSSSSASLTNLACKFQSYEENNNEFVLQDGKAKLIQNNSVPSENFVSNIVPHQHQNISYQDSINVQSSSSSSMEARAANYRTETIITSDTANNTNMLGMQCNTALFPYQNHLFVPLQHMTYHQPNHHPHPIYLVPNYAQIVPYNSTLSMTTTSNHSSFMASQNYYHRAASSSAMASSYHENKQQVRIDVSATYVQSQNVALTNNDTESLDEHCGGASGDLGDHDLIYKSQPPPPFAKF